ncbi:hypothetical protein K457DRAFT_1824736 [Linnemannia elongata AG-77]|uniref:Uncharacterized protein n=1 Tax=Linnemannia elongata AG-77 TaxID=1314771 RepID=A0A197JFR8_9FUNG|nr:hypothetical protein K457DRAFT_1824736 [Linnemannia elongata AG-77]
MNISYTGPQVEMHSPSLGTYEQDNQARSLCIEKTEEKQTRKRTDEQGNKSVKQCSTTALYCNCTAFVHSVKRKQSTNHCRPGATISNLEATIADQVATIVGLNETVARQELIIADQETIMANLNDTVTVQAETITAQGETIASQSLTISDQGATIAQQGARIDTHDGELREIREFMGRARRTFWKTNWHILYHLH